MLSFGLKRRKKKRKTLLIVFIVIIIIIIYRRITSEHAILRRTDVRRLGTNPFAKHSMGAAGCDRIPTSVNFNQNQIFFRKNILEKKLLLLLYLEQ